jgi:hypothetical protein
MSEQFPVFDEQAEFPPHGEYDDICASDEWVVFLDKVHDAEEAMLLYNNPASEEEREQENDIAIERSLELCEAFGNEYNGQPSRVVGLAYTDDMPDETIPFYTNHAIFRGCELKFINGQRQAVFEFTTDGTENDLLPGYYYIPADTNHILELKIRADFGEDDEDEMTEAEIIHEQAEAAQAQTGSGDFAVLPANTQRQVLENICGSADSELSDDKRDITVAVDCERYYTRYNDMPGFDLRDSITDVSSLDKDEDPRAIKGIIIGFDYPELDTLPETQVLNIWNFDIGAGAPCLLVRSEDDTRTYYIPPIAIKDIT